MHNKLLDIKNTQQTYNKTTILETDKTRKQNLSTIDTQKCHTRGFISEREYTNFTKLYTSKNLKTQDFIYKRTKIIIKFTFETIMNSKI